MRWPDNREIKKEEQTHDWEAMFASGQGSELYVRISKFYSYLGH